MPLAAYAARGIQPLFFLLVGYRIVDSVLRVLMCLPENSFLRLPLLRPGTVP